MLLRIFCKDSFDRNVPLMSLALVAKELGYDVEVVTTYSDRKTIEKYVNAGIVIVGLCPEYANARGIIRKLSQWLIFPRRAWRHMRQKQPASLLWIGSADTALALGKKLWGCRYILHIRELYDNSPFYRRALGEYARKADCVVVPEMCRGAILRSWYGLGKKPFVLPNKPAEHPRRRQMEVEDAQAKALLNTIKPDEKILLYQGHLGLGRDVRPVAEAVGRAGSGWRFVAMGPGNADYIASLKKDFPALLHIPRVSAPFHLQITSHAKVGVIVYAWDKLNNVFCAPNKIWEYSGFGLPILCSDLPTLETTVRANNAGVCVDMTNTAQIVTALRGMDENYASFSAAATRLYDSIDTRVTIKLILDNACKSPAKSA